VCHSNPLNGEIVLIPYIRPTSADSGFTAKKAENKKKTESDQHGIILIRFFPPKA
jgi:hypothetical protein